MQPMHIAFHSDPIDQEALLQDIRCYGFAYLDTLRTNAQRIGKDLTKNGDEAIGLAVCGPDGDCHYYLMSLSVEEHDISAIESRVLRVALAWHADGCPLPSVRVL